MKANISPENMITFLLTTPMFEDLEPQEIREIIHVVEALKFDAGETIFREGAPGDGWYALYSGEVEVLKQSNGNEYVIKNLGPRSCFGEIAVLDGLPRSATIRATRECVVLRVPKAAFKDLMQKDPLIAYKLVKQMALILADGQRTNTETLSKLLLVHEFAEMQAGIKRVVGDSSVRE